MFCCMQWYAPFLRHQPHAPLAVCLSSHLHQPHPCTSASDLVLSHPSQRTGHILTIRIVSSWRHLAIRLQRMCTFNSVLTSPCPCRRHGQQRSWLCSCAPLTHTLTGMHCNGQLQQRWTSSLVALRSCRGGRQAVLRRQLLCPQQSQV